MGILRLFSLPTVVFVLLACYVIAVSIARAAFGRTAAAVLSVAFGLVAAAVVAVLYMMLTGMGRSAFLIDSLLWGALGLLMGATFGLFISVPVEAAFLVVDLVDDLMETKPGGETRRD